MGWYLRGETEGLRGLLGFVICVSVLGLGETLRGGSMDGVMSDTVSGLGEALSGSWDCATGGSVFWSGEALRSRVCLGDRWSFREKFLVLLSGS